MRNEIAESQGRLDFAVELEISRTDGPALPNTGRELRRGHLPRADGIGVYVGRIEFPGRRRINESTLRRPMVLQERSPFEVSVVVADDAEDDRRRFRPVGRPLDELHEIEQIGGFQLREDRPLRPHV